MWGLYPIVFILLQCITNQHGKKKESIVILQLPISTSPQLPFQENTTSSGDNDPIERFKRDITELLNTMPNKRIPMCRIPEEYTKHFKKPYMLTNYGGKKTVTLLKNIPDVVMVCISTCTMY